MLWEFECVLVTKLQVPIVHREFSMGVAGVANSIGITIAGVSSIFIHTFVCTKYIGLQ